MYTASFTRAPEKNFQVHFVFYGQMNYTEKEKSDF